MNNTSHLVPLPFTLDNDAWGRLVLTDAEGVEHVGVAPTRLFPISDPDHWVVIYDTEGRELACLEDLSELAPEVRTVLDHALAGREFLPVIERVYRISSFIEPCEWDVLTDRGPTTFVLKDEDDVRRLGPNRAVIVDAEGMRYLVLDSRKLDPLSRRYVERYV